MKTKYWLVLAVAVAGGLQAEACSSFTASCYESRSCPAGGSATDAGAAGEHAGGEEAGGGSSEGGASGSNSSGDGGGGEAGMSGAFDLGESGLPDSAPKIYGPCSSPGLTVCEGHANAERLACDGTKWQPGTTCGFGELCDYPTGACAKIVTECASSKPGDTACKGDSVLTCGPDLVTAEQAPCAGLCKSGVCQAPTCGDKKVEAGEDCDDGDATNAGSCAQCKTASCGDGFVRVGTEQCDDHNVAAGDGCSPKCRFEPVVIDAGDSFTCALSSGGTVKCWGSNGYGQLGIGDTADRGDEPGELGTKLPVVDFGEGQKVRSISAGSNATCAVLTSGQLKCWGYNLDGHLGTGDEISQGDKSVLTGEFLRPVLLGYGRTVTNVSVGLFHSCAVFDDASMRCWGVAAYGALGQGNTTYTPSPAALSPIPIGGKAVASAAGANSYNSCALLDDGTAKCWGLSNIGTLGINGALYNIGPNVSTYINIGDFPNEVASLGPLNFGGTHKVKSIGAGSTANCALLDDDTVRCWGRGSLGELGAGDQGTHGDTPDALAKLPPVDVGTGRKVKDLSVNQNFACAVLDDGSVKCWGANSQGQLGIGDNSNRGALPNQMGDNLKAVPLGRKAVHVTIGISHGCALLDDGSVGCWGLNVFGALGTGNTTSTGDKGGLAGVVIKPVDLVF